MRVCMIAYTFYEVDNRVRRYAEALSQRGDTVDVIALRRQGHSRREVVKGVTVHQIQRRVVNEKMRLAYVFRLLLFLVKSAVHVTIRHLRKSYDVIHVHSIPDFEVFAALIPKLLGAKVILDIHDILPEFYASKFKVTERSPFYKFLMMAERLSGSFADHVIISNDLWKETLISRSLREEKCSVFLNYPDQAVFYRRPTREEGSRFTLLYPGTLNWHQGLDVAIRALSIVKREAPGVEFHVYGEGREKANLLCLTRKLGLSDTVIFRAPLPLDQIADVMANADIGLVPKRRDSFGNEAFSTKILEFMSLGVPVVAANTKVDRYYFDSSMIVFFESGDANDLARRILELMKSDSLRKRLAKNGLKLIEESSSWDLHKGR